MAIVDADMLETDGEFRLWVCLGLSYARSLPTKENPSLPVGAALRDRMWNITSNDSAASAASPSAHELSVFSGGAQ